MFGIAPGFRPALLASLLFVGGCTLFQSDQEDGPSASTRGNTVDRPTISYDVNFNGLDDETLQATLRSTSRAELNTDKPPSSMLILRSRARDDIPVLERALRGLGYYEGKVSYEIRLNDEAEQQKAQQKAQQQAVIQRDDEETAPIIDLFETDATIIYLVTPGPQFEFATLQTELGGPLDVKIPSFKDLGFKSGEPARSSIVLDAEKAISDAIKNAGYPFATAADRDAIVDYQTKTMDVLLRFDPGPRAEFGEIEIVGDKGIHEPFLRKRLGFEQGDLYEPLRLNEARQSLVSTGLFATVRVIEGKQLDTQGRLPIRFEVAPRKHRSIGGGVSYKTDEGPGIRLFWENRNLFKSAERLRVEIEANQLREEGKVSFRKPDFFEIDQALLLDAGAKNENTDAFDSTSAEVGAGLEKVFSKQISGSVGVAYRYVDIEDNDGQQVFGLLSLPVGFILDYSDSFLDPSTGWRLFLDGAPYIDLLGIGTNFLKGQATATRYFRIFNEPRTVIALRGSVGAIGGATRSELPADERFYSGGGGSVRGIGYQLAGPVDDSNDPLGGASLAEFGSELRVKAIGDLELVTFFDGGTVYSTALPNGDEDLRFGTGVGLRYISPVGPLRLDLGFPVNPRDDVDDPFQFYLSIGQAF